jgi:hypothetical protein
MKKLIPTLIFAVAAATPALASDGSETVMDSRAHPAYVTTSNGMGAYASARVSNWQAAQAATIRQQELIQWSVNDR